MYLKMSSPSRPASVATMMLLLLLKSCSMTFSCFIAPVSAVYPLSFLTLRTVNKNGLGNIGRDAFVYSIKNLKNDRFSFRFKDNAPLEEVMEIIVNVVGQMDYRIVEDKCYLTRI
jgi:hypothetical protein